MKEGAKTILFTGELHADVEINAVITAMAKRLRITPEIAHKIVDSGKPRRLKRGLTSDMAIAYQDVLEGLGLHTQIVDEAATQTSAAAEMPEVAAEAAGAMLETPDPEAETPEASTSGDSDTTPGLTTPEVGFSPGIWGWTILMGVGLLIAASVLIEALVVHDQTIPMNATTLHAAGWAVAGVLIVALGSYLLGWLVWLLGKRKSGGGKMVFCLFVLLFGAGVVWINAEKLLVKIEHVREQRASITTVQ